MARRRRVLAVVLVVVGVAAALAADARWSGRHTAAAAAPSAVRLSGESAQAIAPGRLLFVGASYSIGLGASEASDGYSPLLAERLHRSYTVDAVSGTGFQNPGPHRTGTFAQRIAREPTVPAPGIVIIQGGRNDARYPSVREYAAALDTITLAQTRFTSAQVVVLGPIPASLPVSPAIAALRAAISRACATAHAGFIDPITLHWINPANVHTYSGHIRGHPNDAGYAYIADRLAATLPGALHEARPPRQQAPAPTATPSSPTFT